MNPDELTGETTRFASAGCSGIWIRLPCLQHLTRPDRIAVGLRCHWPKLRKFDDADAAKARQLRDKGIAAIDIAKMLGVSRATAYRYLNEDSAA